jgi:Flp pilus assembly protein TadD
VTDETAPAGADSVGRGIPAGIPPLAERLHAEACACFARHAYNTAIGLFRRSIEIDPHWAACHNNLGAALRAAGRTAEAVESYRRAVALAPDYAMAHNNLGATLLALGEPEAALACFRSGLAIAPDSAALQ